MTVSRLVICTHTKYPASAPNPLAKTAIEQPVGQRHRYDAWLLRARAGALAGCFLLMMGAGAGSVRAQDQTPEQSGASTPAVSVATAQPDAAAAQSTVVAPPQTDAVEPAPAGEPSAVAPVAAPIATPSAATQIPAPVPAQTTDQSASATPSEEQQDPGRTEGVPTPPTTPAVAPAVALAPPAVLPLGPDVVARARTIASRSTDKADLAALVAYYGSNPDKPLWTDSRGMTARGTAVAAELGRADAWGLRASDYAVPKPAADPDRAALADAEARLTLAALAYARHARGGRYDPKRLAPEAIDRTPPVMAPPVVLAGLADTSEPDAYLRRLHPQHEQFQRLRKLYNDLKAGTTPQLQSEPAEDTAPASTGKGKGKKNRKARSAPETLTAERVLMNMEMWRWMPEELGPLHITANVPEFMMRVVKDGRVIHAERMIAGLVDKQTPVFSQDMQSIVFHPGWGVPNSIKVKELLPGLLRGRDTLSRSGLRASYKGRPIDPGSIDWTTTDIRNVTVVQPPGAGNVLGVVKFQFPNRHDIYMHDTPTKNLFNASSRTFSHGCMRIRNPVKLAEVIMAETAGWSPARVASLVKGGPMDNKVMLPRRFPVHVTYFTVTVDEAGKPTMFRDVYGHEKKVRLALDGKEHLIPRKVVNLSAARQEVLRNAEGVQTVSRRDQDWTRNVFPGFN